MMKFTRKKYQKIIAALAVFALSASVLLLRDVDDDDGAADYKVGNNSDNINNRYMLSDNGELEGTAQPEAASVDNPSSSSTNSTSAQDQQQQLLGIALVGKADIYAVKDWLYRHAQIFEKLVIIDGSSSPIVEHESSQYDNVYRLPEDTLNLPIINDQTIRAEAMQVLGDPVGKWIMVVHVDEFWTIDPRQVVAKTGRGTNAISVGVLTASPLESAYKSAVQKLSADTDGNGDDYAEDFHIMNICNLVPNYRRQKEMLKSPEFSREVKRLVGRYLMQYSEQRFFMWSEGMRWGDKRGQGVIPAHNPGGYKGQRTPAFYVHFKLHDFSTTALASTNGRISFNNSHLQTGVPDLSSVGWTGSYLDESYPDQYDTTKPRMIEDGLEEFCQSSKGRVPCTLPWTVDAQFL